MDRRSTVVGAARPLPQLKLRHFWRWLHRWIGLLAGLAFVLLGLTGGLLAPEFYRTSAQGARKSFEELIALARARNPGMSQAILAFDPPHGPFRLLYRHPVQKMPQSDGPRYEIALNPNTGAVQGKRLCGAADEIAMNPMHFAGRSVVAVLSTLVHEMVHLWQAHLGKPSRKAYHNMEWAEKMKAIGLQPSDTGEPGGKETGQKMNHYVTPGGAFDKATAVLLQEGFTLSWADAAILDKEAKPKKSGTRVKYTCPDCGVNAWGKGELHLICGDCDQTMRGYTGGE